MARARLKIDVSGLAGMTNDFGRLASPEPFERGKAALDDVLQQGFDGTQLAVPVGTGDHRRPAGALRDSGRFDSDMADDTWTGSVTYGTNDDRLPYAVWARWKPRGKPDYMEPMEEVAPEFDHAVNAPFDDVFGSLDG